MRQSREAEPGIQTQLPGLPFPVLLYLHPRPIAPSSWCLIYPPQLLLEESVPSGEYQGMEQWLAASSNNLSCLPRVCILAHVLLPLRLHFVTVQWENHYLVVCGSQETSTWEGW